jgi:putative addiction module component (TIGR02574 family)
MTETAADLLKKALSLDEADRAALARALIESLDGEPDSDVEETWKAETERRAAELDSGSVETVLVRGT